jgi:type IV pilus assembly protein PilQ
MKILALAVLLSLAAPPKKITVDVVDAEIGNVLRLFADVSGKNLVYGEDVKGKITIKLKNVPWEQALRVILLTKELGMEEEGNIIRIAPRATLDAEQQRALDLAEQRALKGPLVTRLIPVNYAEAKDMAALIKPLLSPRGTVSYDERTNTVIVKDIKGSSALSL